MTNNSNNQVFSNESTGFKLAGGTVKRALTVAGTADVSMVGASGNTFSFPNKTCTIGQQLIHGNNSFYDNGVIHGKASLAIGTYEGNASARDLPCGFFPHFFGTKAITGVQGILWTYMGGAKGSAVVNTLDNVNGVSSDGMGIKLGATAGANTNGAGYNFFAMCAHDGSLPGMKSKVGVYTGTGTGHGISGIGWTPDLLIVKGAGAQYAVFRTSNEVYTSTPECDYFLYSTATLASQGITSLDPDGFTVGTNAVVNTNAVVYQWMAFKYDIAGTSDIAITKYTGVAGDGMHVELPFQPDILIAVPATALDCMFWTSAMTAGNSAYISPATANITDGVRSVDALGFMVGSGTEWNAPQNPVNIIAIKCDS